MTACPYCASAKTEICHRLTLPTATSACRAEELAGICKIPLTIRLCKECLLGFQEKPPQTQELEKKYGDYVYLRPGSGMGQGQYEGILKLLTDRFKPQDSLVEIGCSDGYLLSKLQERGFSELLGIEPGPLALDAQSKGLNVLQGYFDDKLLPRERYDGFYLMHVLEHFSDPASILRKLFSRLETKGEIVLEVPNFTGFEHEHLYYFSSAFFVRLALALSFDILTLEEDDRILRMAIRKGSGAVPQNLKLLNADGLFKKANAEEKAVIERIGLIEGLLRSHRGRPVYWWGSGLGSVLFLNQIDETLLKESKLIVLDGAEERAGLFIPGVNLPIESASSAPKRLELLIIASTFHKEILERLNRQGVRVDQTELLYP